MIIKNYKDFKEIEEAISITTKQVGELESLLFKCMYGDKNVELYVMANRNTGSDGIRCNKSTDKILGYSITYVDYCINSTEIYDASNWYVYSTEEYLSGKDKALLQLWYNHADEVNIMLGCFMKQYSGYKAIDNIDKYINKFKALGVETLILKIGTECTNFIRSSIIIDRKKNLYTDSNILEEVSGNMDAWFGQGNGIKGYIRELSNVMKEVDDTVVYATTYVNKNGGPDVDEYTVIIDVGDNNKIIKTSYGNIGLVHRANSIYIGATESYEVII